MIGFFNDTTAGAAPTGSNAYDPWGNLISDTGHHTDLGYQGEYTDTADGSGGTAVLMGARWYNPSAGQFQNADTASNSPTPLSVNANPYAYAGDSPLDGADPSGHLAEDGAFDYLLAADAADQEVPFLDIATDAATVVVGVASLFWDGGGGDSSYQPENLEYLAAARASGSAAANDEYLASLAPWPGNSDAEVREAHEREAAGWEQPQYGQHGGDQPYQYGMHLPWEPAQQQAARARALAAARLRATQVRAAAVRRARLAAARRAAAQRRIDQRDALADKWVGKSEIDKGATGSVGGRGGPLALAKTVAATPDVLADVAGDLASWAAAGGGGGGGGASAPPATSGSCGPQPDGGTSLPDPSLLSLLPGNNQNQGTTSGGQSFTGDTRVLLPDGKTAPISSLKPGDKVIATDTKTGKNQIETVTAVLLHHDTDLYNLTIKTSHGTEVIHTTSSHLFWDPYPHYGWIPAKHLKPGMHLKTPDGQAGRGRRRIGPGRPQRLDVGPHGPRQQRPRLLRRSSRAHPSSSTTPDQAVGSRQTLPRMALTTPSIGMPGSGLGSADPNG